MIKSLASYADNPFDKREISLDELLAFTTDHLGRLIENDADGAFAGRIAATEAALAALRRSIVEHGGSFGIRKSRKQAKTQFRRQLQLRITKVYASVVAKYGPCAPEVREIFGQGRSIFSRCSDDLLKNHLQGLQDRVAAREMDLGAELLADAEALVSSWLAVYEPSESSTAAKAAAEQARRNAREALQLELFLNLLAILQKFPRQPDKLALYMQESLLRDRTRKKKLQP